MTFKPLLAAATALAIAIPGVAFADTGDVSRVRYGDLDLGSASGRHILDRRLDRATIAVCGTPDAASRFAVATCRTATERDARQQIGTIGSAIN